MALNISVFKYPLGLIRIIEFLFVVIAIAAVNSWSFTVTYSCAPAVENGTVTNVTTKISTFSPSSVNLKPCNGVDTSLWTGENDVGGSAGYFYFTNVFALIYVLVITFVYVIFWDLYQNNKRLPLGDLAVTALLFIFFFFCSSIWWSSSNTMGNTTSQEEIEKLLHSNNQFWGPSYNGSLSRDTNNGKLAISVLCDWVCVITFAFNCWCIWKEIVPRSPENPSSIA